MRYIEPITRRAWNEAEEEYVDTHEVMGYEVRGERQELLGYGETREEALNAAQEFILLPRQA